MGLRGSSHSEVPLGLFWANFNEMVTTDSLQSSEVVF